MKPVHVTYQDGNGKHKASLNPISGEVTVSAEVSQLDHGKIVAKGEAFTIVERDGHYFVDIEDLKWLLAVTQVKD